MGQTMTNPGPAKRKAEDRRDVLARGLCRAMASIHRRGWCEGTGGNFSVVLERTPELQLLMAPSGVDKGRVRRDELILVSGKGAVIDGQGKVSAEMPLHRTIVLTTGAGAVLHTHSQAATLLSRHVRLSSGPPAAPTSTQAAQSVPIPAGELAIEGLEMLKGLAGIQTHECRILLPVLANSQDLNRLSEAAEPLLGGAPHGLLIAGHGLYAWGQDLDQAMRHLEILEFLLEQVWRQHLWQAISKKQP